MLVRLRSGPVMRSPMDRFSSRADAAPSSEVVVPFPGTVLDAEDTATEVEQMLRDYYRMSEANRRWLAQEARRRAGR